jgi:tellurite resistance protein TerC
VKRNGRHLATPLLLVLLVIETTDVIFAVDSIPAIFAVTLDPFIVYTSNVFAILGLRALYFGLAGAMRLCLSLHYGFSAILIFMGGKMLLAGIYKVPTGIALSVVASILTIAIIACMIRPAR